MESTFLFAHMNMTLQSTLHSSQSIDTIAAFQSIHCHVIAIVLDYGAYLILNYVPRKVPVQLIRNALRGNSLFTPNASYVKACAPQ